MDRVEERLLGTVVIHPPDEDLDNFEELLEEDQEETDRRAGIESTHAEIRRVRVDPPPEFDSSLPGVDDDPPPGIDDPYVPDSHY